MSKFDFLDKLDVSTEDFKNEFDKVILWNEVALNGKHNYSPAAIERQYGLCLEEYKEFVEAVNTGNLVEVVDALCDLFVVTSYWCFLNGKTPPTYGFVTEFSDICEQVYYPVKNYKTDEINIPNLFETVCTALASCYKGKACLQNVLESNQSKFLLKDYLDDKGILPEVIASNIEIKSNGRYKNVVHLVSKVFDKTQNKDVEYVLFRCDNGAGKIVKPFMFIEPNIEEIIKDKLI